MLERFSYTNHVGEVLEFGTHPLFVNENDLRNFEWSVSNKNDKISGFKKGVVAKTIPIIIKCENDSEGYEVRNRIFEVFEKDVIAQKYGRINIGDYYLKCYATGSSKSSYLISKGLMMLKLKIQTDAPEWVKETTLNFRQDSGGDSEFLDFAVGFPFDFKNSLALKEVNNQNFVPSNFRMTIYGRTANPSIYIGGHEYAVNVDVEAGEYLTIDSVEKTVVLTKYNGQKINCFNNRNKDSYIFEKIPSGSSIVTFGQSTQAFDLTLLEERSEPKWT